MDSVVADPIEHLHVDGFHYDRRYVQPLTTSLSSALVALASRWGAPTPRACLVPGAGRQVVEVAAEEFDDLQRVGHPSDRHASLPRPIVLRSYPLIAVAGRETRGVATLSVASECRAEPICPS